MVWITLFGETGPSGPFFWLVWIVWFRPTGRQSLCVQTCDLVAEAAQGSARMHGVADAQLEAAGEVSAGRRRL